MDNKVLLLPAPKFKLTLDMIYGAVRFEQDMLEYYEKRYSFFPFWR